MLSEQDILGLLTGTLPAEERARVAAALASDPEAARRAFGAERLAAMAVLLGHAPSSGSSPISPPAAPHMPLPPVPAVSAEEALREALRVSGTDGWAYRPAPSAPGPGLSNVVGRALQEWTGTWHARLLMLAAALALAYAAFALLKSGPPLLRPPATGNSPASLPTNAPPSPLGPAPSSRP